MFRQFSVRCFVYLYIIYVFFFQTHLLYLALDNTLQDCTDLPNSDLSDSEIVQDYKKMSKKHGMTPSSGKSRKVPLQPAGPRVLILSENGANSLEEDPAWDLIAYSKIGGAEFRGFDQIYFVKY